METVCRLTTNNMIPDKVKYSLFLFIGFSFIFYTTLSASESKSDVPYFIKSNLTEVGFEILIKKEELKSIWMKLAIMTMKGRGRSNLDDSLFDDIKSAEEALKNILDLLANEGDAILTVPHIMKKYKSIFSKLRIERISGTKKIIQTQQDYLNYIYGESENKTTLQAEGDPRKIIQLALELLDKSISILQPTVDKK